ncbi:MAG: LysM peptidoglycan-binding domain-containing protein, partial [Lachnospiraceae bacterium]|nr:LysM peptidoglycan-binding domain-containing protein [Lachnospiraceae bacterium]
TERKLPELTEASGQISEEANPLEELLARGNALEGLAPVKDIAAEEGSEGIALTDSGSKEAALQTGKDAAENAAGKEEVLEAAGKVETVEESKTAEESKNAGEGKAGAAGEAQTKEEGKAAEEGKTEAEGKAAEDGKTAKDGKTGGESKAEDGKATAEETKKTPETYVVRAGDTLTGISIRAYGSEKYIQKICQLNSIKNPDEIKAGQKILLP